MKQKVYIFNGTSRAAVYGIGTYVEQLIGSLKTADIDLEVVLLHSEGWEVSVVEKDGYRQISIPAVQFPTPKSSQYYTRNVAYLLKDLIPDDKNMQYIFHLNFMTNPTFVSILKKMFKCKIITTVHYTNWSFSLLGNQKLLQSIVSRNKTKPDNFEKQIRKDLRADKRMLEKSDRFICVAQHTLDSFKSISNLDITNGILINNALKDVYKRISPEQKSVIRNKYLISDQDQVIIFAGRLDEVKGISFLIDAFKKIVKTNPNSRLLIAGDGNFNKWLSIAKNNWTKISFTGRLSKRQLYELYCIADVGVVCSLHEEFGYVAIEMMMHEIPLVVTDTGGLSEIVKDGVCGLKVPVRNRKDRRIINVNTMADKVKILLDNPDFANELGNNARKRFLEKYELDRFKEEMLNLYLNI